MCEVLGFCGRSMCLAIEYDTSISVLDEVGFLVFPFSFSLSSFLLLLKVT